MEGVDHVDVVQVRRGGFVGDIHGVVQRQAPYREGLEFGVAGLDAALVLLVKLAQADGHLAAAGAGGGHDHQRPGRLHEVVLAEALVGVDQGHVVGVAFDRVMVIHPDVHAFQALAIGVRAGLAVVVGDDDAVDAEAALHELVAQAQHVHVVGDAEVVADLVLLDVDGADHDHDLQIVLQLVKHLELAVRLESRQHAAGMVVVEEFAPELHVQFVAEFGDALLDVLRLDPEILLVVVPVLHKNRIKVNTGYKNTK